MKVVAIAKKGAEFIYNASTAHKVPEANAQKVCDALNGIGYKLFSPDFVWHVYDVGPYDNAYYYAEGQRFTYGKTGIKRIAG